MSPWLLKRFSGKTLFFSELLAVSAIVHCIVGLALFVLYRGQYESFSFEVHSKFNPDQPVLFLHHRSAFRSARTLAGHTAPARRGKSANVSKQVAAGTHKQAVAAQKANAKKISPKTATMFLDKVKKSQTAANKNKKQKNISLKVADETQKVVAPAAPPTVVEKLVQHEEPALKQPAPEAVQKNNKQEICAENSCKESAGEAGVESSIPESLDIAVGSEVDGGADELEFPTLSPEAARIYYAVQEEISTRWKPPMGLPKDLVCTVSVRLDRQGLIADIVVKKSSGVLIYDMAASQAAQEMKLPNIAWGKEFSIAFKL